MDKFYKSIYKPESFLKWLSTNHFIDLLSEKKIKLLYKTYSLYKYKKKEGLTTSKVLYLIFSYSRTDFCNGLVDDKLLEDFESVKDLPHIKYRVIEEVKSILYNLNRFNEYKHFVDFCNNNFDMKDTFLKIKHKANLRASEMNNLPLSLNGYLDLLNYCFNSNDYNINFLGLILATGLRPVDIIYSDLMIKDNKLIINKISKVGLENQIVYIVYDKNKIIQTFKNVNTRKAVITNEVRCILDFLELKTFYDCRALYANVLYYHFKDCFDLSVEFKTYNVFLNLVLHHINQSQNYLNYARFIDKKEYKDINILKENLKNT